MKPLRAPVRVDTRTKRLVKRLRPGEIAVIDHRDLDGLAAESLVAGGVSAVINAAESVSGRYPNQGPSVLLRAGVPLLDRAGPDAMQKLHENDLVELDLKSGEIRNGTVSLRGIPVTETSLARQLEAARENLRVELRRFVENTLQYVSREEHVLLEELRFPDLPFSFRRRHALIAVRGEGYRDDLFTIRTYLQEVRPILIAVDGAADALIELGFTPHVILGDMDSVTDAALRCGACLIVHAYADGRSPGKARLEALGLAYHAISATGTSEDLALLMAYEKGAELIVAVGTHSSLVDFLDKGRPGMSSTFLTRLRIGSRLVDARGVSHLYHRRLRWYHVGVPLLIALLFLVGASLSSQGFQNLVSEFFMEWVLKTR